MRITRLTLPSTDVRACLAFYRDVLQLPTSGTTVHVGWTDVELEATTMDPGTVHLAFNIPYSRFGAACAWLRERALLLRDPMGEEQFRIGGVWDSESVYFAGPHDAVLELIARRPLGLDHPATGEFRSSEITCVSEVGLPTEDVPGLVRRLVVAAGLAPFGDVSDAFAPMGDHEGLLIVVDRRRFWFPELRRLPGARGVRLGMEGVMPGVALLDDEGWHVASVEPAPASSGRLSGATMPVW